MASRARNPKPTLLKWPAYTEVMQNWEYILFRNVEHCETGSSQESVPTNSISSRNRFPPIPPIPGISSAPFHPFPKSNPNPFDSAFTQFRNYRNQFQCRFGAVSGIPYRHRSPPSPPNSGSAQLQNTRNSVRFHPILLWVNCRNRSQPCPNASWCG
jgi:hypothetical protein